MFNYYLPDSIYERLPVIYLVFVAALVVAPLAPIKWIAIAALLLAAAVTRHERQIYRAVKGRRNANSPRY